jgi:hypothetical protein
VSEGLRYSLLAVLVLMAIGGVAYMTWQTYEWPCVIRDRILKFWRDQRNGSD